MKGSAQVSRRNFLKKGTLLGGGLLISFAIPSQVSKLLSNIAPGITEMNAFLRIAEDNTIHVIISKLEMGQGIWTTLPMLIAEELDCDWNKIKVQHRSQGKGSNFNEGVFLQITGGSDTTRSEFDHYRMIGATARMMLINAAAKRFCIPPEACETDNGYIINGKKRLSYGEVATEASKLPISEVKLREPSFLGFSTDRVALHTPYLGGSFGRRGSFNSDWIMDAVQIAKASGKFIKLIWSREDDIRGGYYRPVYFHKVRISIGRDGFPLAWHHRVVGQSLFTNTPLAEHIVPNEIDYSSVDGVNGSPYLEAIADHSVELHTKTYGVPVLPWRAVGNTHTAFVMETLIDELAAIAEKDPVEYRRVFLKNHPRHIEVLNLAAEKAQWSKPMPAGRFRGIAVHASMGSVVCQVVEVSIIDKKIHLHRVVCVIDCGLAVNPEGVKAQMESGIVYGITAALYGEITLSKGRVQQSNFHDYRMLR